MKTPFVPTRLTGPHPQLDGKDRIIDLRHINKWRVLVHDRQQGLVVIDLEADNEKDAKGKAHNAAGDLGCNRITGAVAKRWTDLPEAWLRLNARRS